MATTPDELLGPERGLLDDIYETIRFLFEAVRHFTRAVPKPIFLEEDPERLRFRYEKPDEKTLQVLMCVRIVSGLHAALILVRYGKTTEAAVILRTIDEFLGDILFIDEVIRTGIRNAAQDEFISHYFVDHSHTTDELLKNPPRGSTVTRKQKVQASEARTLMPGDPHHAKEIVRAIDSVYDSYTHGAYSVAMELYVGGANEGFMLGSTLGSPRIPAFRKEIANYVHRALNTMDLVARNLGLREAALDINDERRRFETTSAYTESGVRSFDEGSTIE